VVTVVWLLAVVGTAKTLGQFTPGNVEGREFVLGVSFGSDNLTGSENG
jgi:hypothetical protein